MSDAQLDIFGSETDFVSELTRPEAPAPAKRSRGVQESLFEVTVARPGVRSIAYVEPELLDLI